LAVFDAAAGAHPLQFAGPQHAAAATAVAMRERAADHVAQDLHVGVPMRRKPAARRDTVFVDHAQRPETHPPGVVVMAERKRVPAVEPSGVDVAAFGTGPDYAHGSGLSLRPLRLPAQPQALRW